MSTTVEKVVVPGMFTVDGKQVELTNNVWLIGDDAEVIVVDASHDVAPILDAIADRRVRQIVCTHAHSDHINVARELAEATRAPVALHPADTALWAMAYPDVPADVALADGTQLFVANSAWQVLHTPGHTPGGVCLHSAELAVLFSGDTLFPGGPGATGRPYSDFPTIISSIRERLLTLPGDTTVHPGHGEDTTIGIESPHLQEWIARGH